MVKVSSGVILESLFILGCLCVVWWVGDGGGLILGRVERCLVGWRGRGYFGFVVDRGDDPGGG